MSERLSAFPSWERVQLFDGLLLGGSCVHDGLWWLRSKFANFDKSPKISSPSLPCIVFRGALAPSCGRECLHRGVRMLLYALRRTGSGTLSNAATPVQPATSQTHRCTMLAVATPLSPRMTAYHVVQRRTACELQRTTCLCICASSQADQKRQARCDRMARRWHHGITRPPSMRTFALNPSSSS